MSDKKFPGSGNQWKRFWLGFPLRTGSVFFDVLLLAIPFIPILKYAHVAPLIVFSVSGCAIIPLAAALGIATEELSVSAGPRVSGLLNATFGNATELILGFFMLRAGQVDVVKASLSGSIIGNILLVLGMSAVIAGLRKDPQKFTRSTAQINSTMLFVAVAALVLPAIFSFSIYGYTWGHASLILRLSEWSSVVLIVVYVLGLFRIISHRTSVVRRDVKPPARSRSLALLALAVATLLLSYASDILVAQIGEAKQALGISDLFMGAVVIAIIGNVAEHTSALLMARKDRMELAYVISVGSSVQIALFVAPALVLLSWLFGNPMSLLFTPLEIAGIGIAVAAVTLLAGDGETTWFDGVQLLALYLIFGLATYLMPGNGIR